ncbi:MAG: 16S rRNA (uracil(1498)-N(3))-methyltransferase [Deltaproteobacteria bacterium]|nr:16S rRNA (uracil(1498)-N(3))-methyltransferase [Deltaproteobacteria bacterium]
MRRRFFVDRDSIRSDRVILRGSDVRHIRTVLRLKSGEEIILFNGKGMEYRARIVGSAPEAVTLSIIEEYPSISESPVKIAIGLALVKGRKMDLVVRQLTELGIFAILPFIAERSVPEPEHARLARRARRWKTIAIEALKQCGRSTMPHIGPVVSFGHLIDSARDYDVRLLFHTDKLAQHLWCHLENIHDAHKLLALIGPEGGFTSEEVRLALKSNFCCIKIGPRILRSDTAAIAVSTILQYAFGDMGAVQKKS